MSNDRYSSDQTPAPNQSRPASTGYIAGQPSPGLAMADEDNAEQSESRTIAVLGHVGGILTSFILPLILLVVQRDRSPFAVHHARESLNYQIFLILLYLLSLGTAIVVPLTVPPPEFLAATQFPALLFGGVLFGVIFVVLAIYETVLVIVASVAAWRGKWFRYPLIIRFVP